MSLSGYCAGKFALEGFTESLWMEVRPLGVQVSIIEPGNVLTPHFTAHRGRAAAATNPSSAYTSGSSSRTHRGPHSAAELDQASGCGADGAHGADCRQAPHALRGGRGARAVIWARRVIPQRWFERLTLRPGDPHGDATRVDRARAQRAVALWAGRHGLSRPSTAGSPQTVAMPDAFDTIRLLGWRRSGVCGGAIAWAGCRPLPHSSRRGRCRPC